ncbi:hypothetical protein H4R19_004763 [Coemansia spiralis]|nr:hypothetical protein H4R19_004763 [Coemansia spiralis]
MSLVDILSACFGASTASGRAAPHLSADAAAQLPLEAFVQRSLESAPSALEQEAAFSDILRRHVQDGASAAHLSRVVRDTLVQLASTQTERATAQWACQMLSVAAQGGTGSYRPPATHGMSYAQAVGPGGAEHEKQTRPQPQSQPPQQAGGDVYIRSYFFPSEDSFRKLVQLLDSARSSLDICVFNITDNDLARAIGKAHARGVAVRIITDDDQLSCKGNDVERLNVEDGVPFKTDNDPSKFMHSKFVVVDKRTVWAGSFNWTVGARKSNNESVICTNDPGTAQAFSAEFEQLWSRF